MSRGASCRLCSRSLVAIAAFAVMLCGVARAEAGQHKRALPVRRAIAALRAGNGLSITVRDRERTKDWTWVEIDIHDEEYPLTIDILSKCPPRIRKIAYLLPSSSLNFKSSFFTPAEDSLGRYLAAQGYLVVGISPREDNVPLENDQSVMAEWGINKHRNDVRAVIQWLHLALRRPYDIIGHSLGAVCALDYAAVYSGRLDRVILLDMPSFDPEVQPDKIEAAQLARGAYAELMQDGVYSEHSLADLKELLVLSAFYPDADSGVPRSDLGLPGNFTLDGLLHFSLMFSSTLPGIITEITGLPQEWPMVMGNAAGIYTFALDPLEDEFALLLSDVDRIRLLGAEVGSGSVPLALLDDYTSVIAGLDGYSIDWAGIDEEVIWINGELGMGSATYAADLIGDAGNDDVTVYVVPGYGHADVIVSETAEDDVWFLFGE